MSNYDAAFETDLDDDSITYQPSQYLQNDDCSPEELLENEHKERAVSDFIAGMTDRYAINLHKRIK